MNHALTSDKYAKDVGQKTSFYEFFPESQHVSAVNDPVCIYSDINLPTVQYHKYYANTKKLHVDSQRQLKKKKKKKD